MRNTALLLFAALVSAQAPYATAATAATAPTAATAATAATQAAPEDEDAGPSRSTERAIQSIAYPNGALYMSRGITGAFLLGRHKNLGEDQSLYQWQGELGYFYTPYFSGGLGFRITAGEPSDTAQKIFTRYFLNVRLHHAWSKVAIYTGIQFGGANLNILTDSPSDSLLKKPIDEIQPTLSLDLGGGWKFSRYVGLTLGCNLEYSLVDEEGVGTTNALNLHFNPGLSLDLLMFAESWRELVPALYAYVEFQRGILIFEKESKRNDQAGVIGVGLAF